MSVTNVNPLSVGKPVEPLGKPPGQAGPARVGASFGQALQSLSDAQNASDALVQQLAAGENVDLHQVMIAAEETDISFRVALAMRDKLVEAYHEVMRMAV